MRIYSKGTIKHFWVKHPDSKNQLLAWYDIISKNEYKNPNEIKEVLGSADFVKNGKMVFNICGNKYRLIVKINYIKHLVFVLFVGTHKEYDKIDVNEL